MKKYIYLIVIFLFFFNTIAKADDISEFEVEGISIGDSALDYFSKETLNKKNVIGLIIMNTQSRLV